MKKLIILFLISFSSVINSQVAQQWASRYSASGGQDTPMDMAVDASGNVYVTGTSIVNGTGSDFLTIKYNSAGVQQWEARFTGVGGANSDDAFSIELDAAGNVYVGGTSLGSGTGLDIMIIKYSNSGTVVWEVRYTNAEARDDELSKMIVDAAGNVYVAGISNYASTQKDFVTIKYNSAGQTQWVKNYSNGNNNDYLSNMAVDASGNVYVTGYSFVPGNSYDFVTIKYNSAGVQQYYYSLNAGGEDTGTDIAVDAAGNAYIAGVTDAYGTGLDYFVYSINSSGSYRWLQRYNGPANGEDRILSIITNASGNVIVSGYSNQGATGFDPVTIMYNSAGTQQWLRTLNVGGDDRAYDLNLDAAGNIYLAGKTNAYGTADDYITCSYNANGDFRWLMAYNNSPTNGNDFAVKILTDASGNVYVTGASSGGGNDYLTIKYASATGIEIINNQVPDKFSLSQNYPNPFNPSTKINFSIPANDHVKLTVFDAAGKVISVLADDELNAGIYNVDFNASSLPSGVYFYRLSAGSYDETKKMILIK